MISRIPYFKLLLFFTLLLIISSCNDKHDTQTIKIGFSQCFSNHPYRDAMNQAIKTRASLHPNTELTIYEAHSSLEKQIQDVEKMLYDGTDIIIISPIETDSIVHTIDKAVAKGIPVIILDRKINSDNYTAYVGADNLEVGRNAAKFIASQEEGTAKIIELTADGSSSPDIERSEGFREVIEKKPNLKLLASIVGDETVLGNEGLQKIYDSLPENEKIYVYAFNDQIALDAWELAHKNNIEDNLRFVGVDGLNGTNNGIDLVRKGILEASILYPTGGYEAVELGIEAAQGIPIPKVTILPSTVIDRHNAGIMKNQMDRIDIQQADLEKQVAATREQEEKYYAQKTLLYIVLSLLALVLTLTIYSIYSMVQIRKKNDELTLKNEEITSQRNQIEQIAREIKEVNEKKFSFFTGLSHEFKTPLTLIMSSIESLKEGNSIPRLNFKKELNLIENNSQRLLRLMNNLLDFRKTEESNFNLRASKTNIYDFSAAIFNEFIREAKKRSISFSLECNNKDLELFIDRNLMDKVYFNLLSNAFKFTPDNGKIDILINDVSQENKATIIFRDNGIGIPEDEIVHIFEPFFKGSNNRKNSTGIGLHLSKKFIDLHLGKIEIKSTHGTEFMITLFKGSTHFNEDQIIKEVELPEVGLSGFLTQFDEMETDTVEEAVAKEEKLLVIEDNTELSEFLRSKLKNNYELLLSDGTDAIEKALTYIPDLLICDVNLPQKNGFEICKILRNDLRTSHIPIIILTALSDKESYIKGLEAGADTYLTKPFSFAVLEHSIKSLLYNRERLRYYYSNNLDRIENSNSFGAIEQEFVQRLNELINENLDNSDFSVEELAENLGVSRVQLYRKVKATMGISISDYMSNHRLEKAKSKLSNAQLSIAEVAYSCGFSSPNYFSTAFKNKYGVTPATYRKST